MPIRILVVDDKKQDFDRIKNNIFLLSKRGEIALPVELDYVDDYAEAIIKIELGIYHVAIIDLSLCDDDLSASSNYDEYLGLKLIELVHKYNKDTIIIAYTSHVVDNFMKLLKLRVDSILGKAESEDIFRAELTEIMLAAQKTFNLRIDLEIDKLLIKYFKGKLTAGTTQQWEICLQKLFAIAKEKKYMRLSQGFSGAGVAIVFIDKQLPKVIKLYDYDKLKMEVDNYENFVRYYVPKAAATRMDDLAQAGTVGILSYSFVGPEKKTYTLGDIIKNTTDDVIADDDIVSAIRDFFNSNCNRWFARTNSNDEPIDLATEIKKYFNPCLDNLIYDSNVSFKNFLLNGHGTNIVDRAADHIKRKTGNNAFTRHHIVEIIGDAITAEYDEFLCKPLTYCHGDLNVNNLIWENGTLWMIDFAKTGELPRIIDFVKLEASIKFDSPVKYDDGTDLDEKIDCELLIEDLMHDNMKFDIPADHVHKRKLLAIAELRQCALKQCGSDCKNEYNLALFYTTVKHVEYLICNQARGKKDLYDLLVHALVSSYRLATYIKNLSVTD
jgi:hypothetical protein